jgi:hypothetical protein
MLSILDYTIMRTVAQQGFHKLLPLRPKVAPKVTKSLKPRYVECQIYGSDYGFRIISPLLYESGSVLGTFFIPDCKVPLIPLALSAMKAKAAAEIFQCNRANLARSSLV